MASLDRLMKASPVRPARLRHLHREQVVAAPTAETFAFFADAANLEVLTPSWLNFEILTPMPVEMRAGLLIEYRIRLYGIPIPWRTLIDDWEPGVRFVDRQVVGPYRWWHHEHSFREVPDGTLVTDHVAYLPRLPALTTRRVARDLERIFDYRREELARRFGAR